MIVRKTNDRSRDTDLGPCAASMAGHRGSLVSGGPGPLEQARINSRRFNAAARERLAQGAPPPEPKPRANRTRFYATDEERVEAARRRFRESKARQRARRAELRADVAAIREGHAA
jgi:hypothetical protein